MIDLKNVLILGFQTGAERIEQVLKTLSGEYHIETQIQEGFDIAFVPDSEAVADVSRHVKAVIVVSHNRSPAAAVSAIKAGAHDYLTFDSLEELSRSLEELKVSENTSHANKPQLQITRENYWQLAETSPVGVSFSSPEGKIEYVNPHWSEITGYSKEEAIGKDWTLVMHPDDIERVFANFNRDSAIFRIECRVIKKSGAIGWTVGQSSEYYQDGKVAGYIGSITEITDRILAERALEKERNFTNAVFDNAGALIMVLDKEARVVRFNHTCERTSGYRFEEVNGMATWDTPMHLEERAEIARAYFKETWNHKLTSFEGYWRTKDGEIRLIAWSVSTLRDNENQVTHIVAVGHDATEQREAEKKAEQRRIQLVQADKLASLGTLVAGVAHEINNPNNYIMINSQILQDFSDGIIPVLESYRREKGGLTIGAMEFDMVAERLPIMIEAIRDGSARIKEIVSSLKDFARQEAGDSHSPIDVNQAVQRAASLSLLSKGSKSFHGEYGSDLPSVVGERQRLEQVLINLFLNAFEALPDPSCSVTVSTAHDADQKQVVIIVKDEGVGIPPHIIKHITDPFFTTKRDTGGTGLGLSVSDSIIREHGGSMSFSSEPGQGATVTIRLPAAD